MVFRNTGKSVWGLCGDIGRDGVLSTKVLERIRLVIEWFVAAAGCSTWNTMPTTAIITSFTSLFVAVEKDAGFIGIAPDEWFLVFTVTVRLCLDFLDLLYSLRRPAFDADRLCFDFDVSRVMQCCAYVRRIFIRSGFL